MNRAYVKQRHHEQGFDFLGDEYSFDVEEVWSEARRFNQDVFGMSRFEDLGTPEERISIREVSGYGGPGYEAAFTWPDGEVNAGGKGQDISYALYLLYADLTDKRAPHDPTSPMNAPREKTMMKNARGSVADEHAARELVLFTTNDGALWGPGNTQGAAIRENLNKKIKSGKLDLTKVPKLFEYLMTSASNAYAKEFGSRGDTGSSMFNAATRRLAAKEMAQEYLDELAYTTPNGRALPVAMHIFGRRWRDSSGNTYHTVVINFEMPDGAREQLETTEPEYGYGDAYIETALEVLGQEGIVPPARGVVASRYLRDLGIPLEYDVEDVKRKKDL